MNFTYVSHGIFKGSKIPIKKLLYIIFQFANNNLSTSSVQTAKNIELTQKSTWQILHKLRSVLYDARDYLFDGIIEVDEVFLSRSERHNKRYGLSKRKAPILGILQRDGEVRIELIPNRKSETLKNIIFKNVESGSTIYTDGHIGYRGLSKYYNHDYVIHSDKEFVKGDIHTNTIESFWSLLKKNIRTAYGHVSYDWIGNYCNELEYRYNRRKWNTRQKFDDLIVRSILTSPRHISFRPHVEYDSDGVAIINKPLIREDQIEIMKILGLAR